MKLIPRFYLGLLKFSFRSRSLLYGQSTIASPEYCFLLVGDLSNNDVIVIFELGEKGSRNYFTYIYILNY